MLHFIPWLFGSLLLGFSCNVLPWSVLISYCLFKSGFLPSSRNLSLKLYHLLRDLQELYMYYQCCNPCGTRDWIGCTTAPRRREKMETLGIFSLAGTRSLGNATQSNGKFSWRENLSIITEFVWTGKRFKCHGFSSALSLVCIPHSHSAHMPKNYKVIQSHVSCNISISLLQKSVLHLVGGSRSRFSVCREPNFQQI